MVKIVLGKQQTFRISDIFLNFFWSLELLLKESINTLTKVKNRFYRIIIQAAPQRKTFQLSLYFLRNYKICKKKIKFPKYLNLKQEKKRMNNYPVDIQFLASVKAQNTSYVRPSNIDKPFIFSNSL